MRIILSHVNHLVDHVLLKKGVMKNLQYPEFHPDTLGLDVLCMLTLSVRSFRLRIGDHSDGPEFILLGVIPIAHDIPNAKLESTSCMRRLRGLGLGSRRGCGLGNWSGFGLGSFRRDRRLGLRCFLSAGLRTFRVLLFRPTLIVTYQPSTRHLDAKLLNERKK